jgi:hypothetical protein
MKNLFEFISELFYFLKERKKLWLSPIVFIIFLLGGLLILANGSVIAPFIYTIF